jgi:hypothetical protein
MVLIYNVWCYNAGGKKQKLHNQWWWSSWIIDGVNKHNFERVPKEYRYLDQICFHSIQWDDYHWFGLVEKFDIFENIVLQNHWMEWKQIWSKYRYSFGTLSKLCLIL